MRIALRTLVAVVGMAIMAGLVAAPATAAEAACPASLRSVAGGAGDASSGGYDDGVVGEEAAYVGGEIVLTLNENANREVLNCIALELGAYIEEGEKPKVGFIGLDHLALLQLPPGKSVAKTIQLLNRPRYREYIENAEPNQYYEPNAISIPNDPLFEIQWNLMNRGFVAKEKDNYTVNDGNETILPAEKASMRFPQAWEYMRRGAGVSDLNPAGLYPRINVAIIDNSLFEHSDLWRNTDRTLGGMMFGSKYVTIDIAATKFERFSVELGETPKTGADTSKRSIQTCKIFPDASADEISSILTRGLDELCSYEDVRVYDLIVIGGAGKGKYRLKFGNQLVGEYDVNEPAAKIAADLAARVYPDVSVTTLSDTMVTSTTHRDIKRIIIPAEAGNDAFTAELNTLDVWSKAVSPSVSLLSAPDVFVSEVNPVPAESLAKHPGTRRTLITNMLFPPYASAFLNTFKIDQGSIAAPSVWATGGNATILNTANGWPGRSEPTAGTPLGGVHGQNIAGMIGAETNNGIGISGAIGPYHNIKMYGLVAPNMSGVEIAGAIDEILRRNELKGSEQVITHVVNMSFGSPISSDSLFEVTQGEDPDRGSFISNRISKAPADSPTLFISSAGNDGGNINDQVTRDKATYNGKKTTAAAPCRPKGHGVTERPELPKLNRYTRLETVTVNGQAVQQLVRRPTSKGGILSYLKMPDGTYDRGNLMCIGSVNWRGEPSGFTNWGRGTVEVAAPGSNIIGTSSNDGYDVGDGTSYSAPLVSAAAALVYSSLPPVARKPWLVKCALMSSATAQPLAKLTEAKVNALTAEKYDPRTREFARTLAMDPRSGYPSGAEPTQMGPNGEMFTVNGIVNAQLAIKAGQSLARKIARGEHPTCVQRQTLFGGWTNTRTQ